LADELSFVIFIRSAEGRVGRRITQFRSKFIDFVDDAVVRRAVKGHRALGIGG